MALEPLLSEKSLAEYLDVSVSKLRRDREKNRGIRYQKVADQITKCTRKKFPVSWVFKILKREGAELKVA